MAERDLIIIGGGHAGLTAGLYGSRAGLQTLLVEKLSPGGQVLITDQVENYPGFPEGLSGFELVEKMTAHARKFGMEEMNGEVIGMEYHHPEAVTVKLADGNTLAAKAVIIATGAGHRRLEIPGEEEFTGRGVSYCATCDGPFFRDQEVAVIGGGDSAVQEAIFLTKFASRVYLIHRRDRLRAVKALQERAFENPKIEFIYDSVVKRFDGDESGLRSVTIENLRNGKVSDLAVGGGFIFVGMVPNTGFLKGVVDLDGQGFVITDEWMKTSANRIFAAGDCRSKPLLQIVTAASDGATAAFAAEHLIYGV